MSLIWIALSMAGLMYQAAALDEHEIKARPFSTVRLPCEFTFMEGMDQLQFTWVREEIVEKVTEYVKYSLISSKEFEIPKSRAPKILVSFQNNAVVQEGDSYEYEGRIKLNPKEFGDGILTLLLENVSFADEGIYRCKARSPHGRGERVMKLLLEDEEAPQVQLEKENNEFIAECISTGWYKNPIVTWSDGTRNMTATVKTLEARPDGTHRVLSVLHAPENANGPFRCLIREAEKVQRPRYILRRLLPVPDSFNLNDYQ